MEEIGGGVEGVSGREGGVYGGNGFWRGEVGEGER